MYQQDTRYRLLDLVRREPGVTLAEAAARLRVDYSTVTYHVRVLTRHRAVVCTPLAGALRLYPPGAVPSPDHHAALAALAHPTAQAVAAAVRGHGPATLRDIAVAVGRPRTTVQDHLRRLAEAGVITRHDGTRGHEYVAPGQPHGRET